MAQNIPTIESLVAEATKVYKDQFQSDPDVAVCAPGRVNLIGEHIDYNEGFVLPMALPLVTVIVGSKIPGFESIIITTNDDADLPKKASIEMPNKRALIPYCQPGKPFWANYVRGVIVHYIGEAPTFQAVVVSSVPLGGGVSSSASLAVAAYTFFDALNGPNNNVLPTNKALACQKAENKYVGVPCGIMDQFISLMGKKDNALLIDCRTLSSTLIPLADPNIMILITNSNVKHSINESEYSSRRKQCEQAALLLKKLSLRDANYEDIKYLESMNTDVNVVKRAKHVVSEIERTQLGAEALKVKNYHKFGELMTQSHNSLRDNHEVSCPELNELVDLALEVEGVLGSRLTGGGFGGCTVTMVYNHAVDRTIEHIKKNYKGKPTFYICMPTDGARILQSKTEGHYY